jgi:hypothetical protein
MRVNANWLSYFTDGSASRDEKKKKRWAAAIIGSRMPPTNTAATINRALRPISVPRQV